MSKSQEKPKIRLPKGWKKQVGSAVLHVISLAQYATAYTRGWAADSINARLRLKAELERTNQEVALLREEIRSKDARLARIIPHRRPHYPPVERFAILELRAARGWPLEQTARAFQVTAATIASWVKRIDEQGPDALVQLREPVNKFPDFVRYVVQQLKTGNARYPSPTPKALYNVRRNDVAIPRSNVTQGALGGYAAARPWALECNAFGVKSDGNGCSLIWVLESKADAHLMSSRRSQRSNFDKKRGSCFVSVATAHPASQGILFGL